MFDLNPNPNLTLTLTLTLTLPQMFDPDTKQLRVVLGERLNAPADIVVQVIDPNPKPSPHPSPHPDLNTNTNTNPDPDPNHNAGAPRQGWGHAGHAGLHRRRRAQAGG